MITYRACLAEESNLMKRFFILGGFLFLFFLGFTVAESCYSAGDVNALESKYCDSDLQWQDLKQNGEECLNSFECTGDSCVEGICQSKYASLNETQNLLNLIWSRIQGYQCVPGQDDCASDKKLLRTCGNQSTWENKNAYVIGRCGYNGENGTGDNDDGGGSGTGISIYISSPLNKTYTENPLKLEARDINNRAKYWSYVLNGGIKTNFTSPTTITAREGGNSISVYAKKTLSGTEISRTIFFSYNPAGGHFCGDNVLDEGEECDSGSLNSNNRTDSCRLDCRNPYCGDSVCDSDESSNDCIQDCEPVDRKDYTWLFWILVLVLISGMVFVGILIYKNYKMNKGIKAIHPKPGQFHTGKPMQTPKPKSPPLPPSQKPQMIPVKKPSELFINMKKEEKK